MLQLLFGRAGQEPREARGQGVLIQELRNALLVVAEERARPGFISAKRLGWWLGKMDGKISNGLRIIRAGMMDGYSLWSLTA